MVLPYEQAGEDNRPPPPSEDVRRQWDEQNLRYAMLRGTWEHAAEERLKEDFHQSTWDFLPKIVLSFNPQKTYTQQTATLYDSGVTVHGAGDDLDALGLDLLWPQQQETLEYVRAMNDALLLRSWDDKRQRVRYTAVPPGSVDAEPDPDDPSQPWRVVHYRKRRVPGYGWVWCRDTYDFSGRYPRSSPDEPERVAPYFSIEAWIKQGGKPDGHWEDVTLDAMPELAAGPQEFTGDGEPLPRRWARPGRWPYWTGPAVEDPIALDAPHPIWPWTAYHKRVGSRLFDPWADHELVDLTLVTAVLWTYWLGGFRDAAYLQRYMLDADIAGPQSTPGGDNYVHTNVFTILKLKSASTTQSGTASAWPSAFDVEKAGTAIANLTASGALFAGLSPADVSIGSAGLSRTSGFAIEVSRDGKRKVEMRMLAPMQIGDRHNLAGAAQLANAYAGTSFPTDPEAYALVYSSTPRTTDEIRAEVDEVTRLTEAGLMHPAAAIRRLNPHLTDDEAQQAARDIATFKAELAALEEGAVGPSADEVTGLLEAIDDVLRAGPMPDAVATRLQTIRESAAAMAPNAPPAPEVQREQVPDEPEPAPNAPPGPEPTGDQPLAATALNGAQVTAALEIIRGVAAGELPRASGIEMLRAFFQLSAAEAEAVMGEVGNGFLPTPKAPPPFGGAPPPPEPDADDNDDDEDAAPAA